MGLFACSLILQDPAETRSRNVDLSCKSLLPCYSQLLWDREVPKSQKAAWIFQANLESQEAQIVWITYSQALQFTGAYPNQTLDQVTHPSVPKHPSEQGVLPSTSNQLGGGARQHRDGVESAGMDFWSQGLEGREGAITFVFKHEQTGSSRSEQSIMEAVFNKQLCETSLAAPT